MFPNGRIILLEALIGVPTESRQKRVGREKPFLEHLTREVFRLSQLRVFALVVGWVLVSLVSGILFLRGFHRPFPFPSESLLILVGAVAVVALVFSIPLYFHNLQIQLSLIQRRLRAEIELIRSMQVKESSWSTNLQEELSVKESRATRISRIPKQAGGVAAKVETEEMLQVLDRATQVIGDEDAALRWLGTPVRALSYATPISLLSTVDGAIQVLTELDRLEHGVL